MQILVSYRGIPGGSGWETGASMVRAFRALGHEVVTYGHVYHSNNRLLGHWDGKTPIDLALCMECGDEEPQHAELGVVGARRAYWDFDTALHEGGTVELVFRLNPHRVFLANPRYVEAGRFGAHYLPYAADPELCPRGTGPRRGIAILGSPFRERLEFCEQTGIGLEAGLFRESYARKLASLQVHVHHHASGGNGLLVMRVWETLACGTCLLTEDDPSLLRHFEPGRHLVTYRDAADCRDKAKWLLADDEARERIAAAGHAEVMAHHTYRHRAEEILRVMGLS